jgi:hypothetical protein
MKITWQVTLYVRRTHTQKPLRPSHNAPTKFLYNSPLRSCINILSAILEFLQVDPRRYRHREDNLNIFDIYLRENILIKTLPL